MDRSQSANIANDPALNMNEKYFRSITSPQVGAVKVAPITRNTSQSLDLYIFHALMTILALNVNVNITTYFMPDGEKQGINIEIYYLKIDPMMM